MIFCIALHLKDVSCDNHPDNCFMIHVLFIGQIDMFCLTVFPV